MSTEYENLSSKVLAVGKNDNFRDSSSEEEISMYRSKSSDDKCEEQSFTADESVLTDDNIVYEHRQERVSCESTSYSDGYTYMEKGEKYGERSLQAESQLTDTNSIQKKCGGNIGPTRQRGYIYDPKPIVSKEKCSSQISSIEENNERGEKRLRNNEAAKRSRRMRREKEIEFQQLMKELQKRNEELTRRVTDLEGKNEYLEFLILKSSRLLPKATENH